MRTKSRIDKMGYVGLDFRSATTDNSKKEKNEKKKKKKNRNKYFQIRVTVS